MGLCLCSRAKHGDPEDGGNRFRVINVNDNGKNVCPGIMELTETSLIFHIKRGSFVKWPYISLMKYGYDSNLFSFVCGSRCQTGEGIFGFRCSRAEELFNLLQSCMQNNRISVISDTDGDTPVAGAVRSLPYRYEAYPSFPAASSILSSSHRPEPIGSEYIPDPRSSECCTSAGCKEVKRPHGSHLPLEQRVSDGGISQMSMHSYLDVEERRRGIRLDQAYMVRNMIENEEIETFDSIHSGDINGLIWDTGYDSDDRRETSWVRRMGYENVSAIQGACVKSRSMLVSVSSSDSQSTSIIPTHIPAGGVASQPSSPSIFEEQYDLEQNISTMNEGFGPLYASKQLSSARDTMIRQDCSPLCFNFDLRQTCQGSKTLNYIQVEMESGCDSDNPQTPQSPDGSVQWSTCHQSEFYTELDLEKTTALSLIQRNRPKEDGTRKTRHNSKHFPA